MSYSSDEFMKEMEEDAKQRAEEKKKREVEADKLKEQGNVAFKEGRYDEAVDYYSQAIHEVHTNTALFTNRAQVCVDFK